MGVHISRILAAVVSALFVGLIVVIIYTGFEIRSRDSIAAEECHNAGGLLLEGVHVIYRAGARRYACVNPATIIYQ